MSDQDGVIAKRVDEAQERKIVDMINAMKLATAPFIAMEPDPRVGMSLVMTAAAQFAGTMFGQLIAMGEARDQDTRRAAEAAAHNFRSGIGVGKLFVARMMAAEAAAGGLQ